MGTEPRILYDMLETVFPQATSPSLFFAFLIWDRILLSYSRWLWNHLVAAGWLWTHTVSLFWPPNGLQMERLGLMSWSLLSWGDGSVGKAPAWYGWPPGFGPQISQKGGRRELAPENCLLTSVCTLWCTHAHAHTQRYNNNNYNFKREIRSDPGSKVCWRSVARDVVVGCRQACICHRDERAWSEPQITRQNWDAESDGSWGDLTSAWRTV